MVDRTEASIKIRTVVADDESLARQKLRLLLESEPMIEVVAECSNLVSTQAALRTYKPDLLLLDIQMPDGSGFDALNGIDSGESPIVIFTTAFDQYAVRAFEAHALDYLLKPFDRERLHEAIERARLEFVRSKNGTLTNQLLELLKNPSLGSTADDRFVIKAGGRIIFLHTDEIDYIEAAANYVRVHAGKNSYMLRETMSGVASRLDPKKFGRIHRSFIVNVRELKELQPCGSGEYMAILKDGRELPCSRSYRSAVQSFYERLT